MQLYRERVAYTILRMNKKEPFQKGLVPFFGQGRIEGGFKRTWSRVGWLVP